MASMMYIDLASYNIINNEITQSNELSGICGVYHIYQGHLSTTQVLRVCEVIPCVGGLVPHRRL